MATAAEQRNYAVDLMTGRKGLNSYTQLAKRKYFFGYPDNTPGNTAQRGYSDCSSAVRAAIKAATGVDIGSNTSAQINNRKTKGLVVHETAGYYPDESKLLPGDCLYFKGNASHPLDVGHVEMYIGNGQICGHGGGSGPKIRNMKDYCADRASKKRRYFMAVRWILTDSGAPANGPSQLKPGMYDSIWVQVMQKNLISLGYDLGADGADGDFGPMTEKAVKAFQLNNGMPMSGVADAQTLEKINELLEGFGDPDIQDFPDLPILSGVDIASGSWNIRKGPGTEYPIAGVTRGGDRLEKAVLNDWIPVIFGGELCFISPKAVKK